MSNLAKSPLCNVLGNGNIELLRSNDRAAMEFCVDYISTAWNETPEAARQRFLKYADQAEGSFCLVAKNGGTPVGMIVSFSESGPTIDKFYDTTSQSFSPWVAGLYVIESQRKMGWGPQLLGKACECLREMKQAKVHLGVEHERLKNWYLKMGWSPVGNASWEHHKYDVLAFDLKK